MITKRSSRWFVSPGGYFFTVAGLEDKDKKSVKSDFSSVKPWPRPVLQNQRVVKGEVAAMRRKYGSSPAGLRQ